MRMRMIMGYGEVTAVAQIGRDVADMVIIQAPGSYCQDVESPRSQKINYRNTRRNSRKYQPQVL
jgi:hypothetical protein